MFFLETTKMKKSNQYKHIRFVTWQWQDDQEKKEALLMLEMIGKGVMLIHQKIIKSKTIAIATKK